MLVKNATTESIAATSITENSLMRAISDNPVSMASYVQMQKAGVELQFNHELLTKNNAIGVTKQSSRVIELDPVAIEAEANLWGYDPSEYAARVFTHEASHGTYMARRTWENTRYFEYQAYKREYLFQCGARPSLETRQMIWTKVGRDYSHLPIGKNPFAE